MSAEKWEYKVAFVDSWDRTSIEGEEQRPEEGERNSAFGRRFLNGLGVDGWELVAIQHTGRGSAYYVFKRPLDEGAEPDLSVKRREQPQQQPQQPQQPNNPPSSGDGSIVSM